MRQLLEPQRPTWCSPASITAPNLAEDVTYSGTIAAAIEGTLLGVRSIALSQTAGSLEDAASTHWETPLAPRTRSSFRGCSRRAGRRHRDQRQFSRRARPPTSPALRSPRKVAATRRRCDIDKRSDPWGTPYFWFSFDRPPSTLVAGTDLAAIDARAISVTPLSLDLTHEATCRALEKAFPPPAIPAALKRG